MDAGHWVCDDIIPPNAFGFVYLITNLKSGRRYIGKKQMKFKKRRKSRRKLRAEIFYVESDWKTYTGSCDPLNVDITKLGKVNFRFEIVSFHGSKWELSYEEARLQFEERVLYSKHWYNGNIHVRLPKAPKGLLGS